MGDTATVWTAASGTSTRSVLNRLDMGGRRDAGRHGAVMHVDRAMDVEHGAGVRDFAIRNAQRDHDAAFPNGLTVDRGLVLINVGAEQAIPEARLRDVRPTARPCRP